MKERNPSNPSRPFDSPIRTEHAGTWDPTEYRNYASTEKPKPMMQPFGRGRGDRTVVHDNVHEFQESKTEEKHSDEALEREIKKDLTRRNIK